MTERREFFEHLIGDDYRTNRTDHRHKACCDNWIGKIYQNQLCTASVSCMERSSVRLLEDSTVAWTYFDTHSPTNLYLMIQSQIETKISAGQMKIVSLTHQTVICVGGRWQLSGHHFAFQQRQSTSESVAHLYTVRIKTQSSANNDSVIYSNHCCITTLIVWKIATIVINFKIFGKCVKFALQMIFQANTQFPMSFYSFFGLLYDLQVTIIERVDSWQCRWHTNDKWKYTNDKWKSY